MKKFTAADVAAIKDQTHLTAEDLGQAIGYGDASRTVRALIAGERHGKPFVMSGTAIRALNYLLALQKLTVAHLNYQTDMNPTTEHALTVALDEAVSMLPKKMLT